MKKLLLAAAAAGATIALPTAAQAQDLVPGSGFVGVQAGVHDLGLDDELQDVAPELEFDDSSPLIGVFAGYDFPVGPAMFLGVEGNYNFGTDVLDGDYGVNARLGVNAGLAKVYGRAGYQWIDVDYNEVVNDGDIDFSDFDDVEGDYLVGVGVDVPLGGAFIRGNVDTISFDTMRATLGVGLRF